MNKRQFDLFSDKAGEIIQRLHSDYKSWDVGVSDIDNNMFQFSYRFDSLGNLNQMYLVTEFAASYYVDFVNTILEKSSSGRI